MELTAKIKLVKFRLWIYLANRYKCLRVFFKSLVCNGVAHPNPTTTRACASRLLPGTDAQFFLFSAVKPVNKYNVQHQYSITNLEHEITIIDEKRPVYSAKFDMSHSPWGLLPAQMSHDYQSMIIFDGRLRPAWVLHCMNDTVTYVQSSLTGSIAENLQQSISIWLDDMLQLAKPVEQLLT